MTVDDIPCLPASEAETLLRELARWGPTTTVVRHGGSVFEFKGPFPPGAVAEGYYNLAGATPGFHGHIQLQAVASIGFQARPHRGRDSYAFVFRDSQDEVIFKVFLGRDAAGALYPEQVKQFHAIRDRLSVSTV